VLRPLYTEAIIRARTAFDMAEEAGYAFSLLDVGGAFKDFPFGQAATYLNNGVDRYFPDWRCTKIIAEPGRFYVPKAFRLAANITALSE
jgi:ornithine decarboxylase